MKWDESLDHVAVLDEAWSAPGNTTAQLPPVDVNAVLAERYRVAPPLAMTGAMLWDMEVRKASAPDVFIPGVVTPGTADKWELGSDGAREWFVRVSEQKLWLDRERSGLVIEATLVDHDRRAVTFIGLPEFVTPDGRTLTATTDQPLFHVEHAVSGSEERPINDWRAVHLTEGVDARLVATFGFIAAQPWLAEYVEIYSRENLDRDLARIT